MLSAQPAPTALRTASYEIDLLADIVESPHTIGMADSNLFRLATEAEVDRQLDMIQSMGVQNLRIGLYWAEIEAPQGEFDWERADYIINSAYERGMGVLATLNETPAWVPDALPLSGMPDPELYADYVAEVVTRYDGKISAIEIWNEPNAAFFLSPVDPAGYTAMLKAAHDRIAALEDSGELQNPVTIVAGVLGSGRTVPGVTMNPIAYLEGMYEAGAQGYFDALSYHPYKYDVKFSEQTGSDMALLQMIAMRAVMRANGDEDVKIWATEYGVPTSPRQGPLDIVWSEEHQAEFIEDFLNNWGNRLLTGEDREITGPIFIYSTRDIETGAASDGNNFGVFRTDWTAKEAVQVITCFIDPAAEICNVVPPVTSTPNPFLQFLANIVRGTINATTAVVRGVVNATAAVVRGVVHAVVGIVDAVASAAAWAIRTAVNVTTSVVRGLTHLIGQSIQATFNLIRTCFGLCPGQAARLGGELEDVPLSGARVAGPATTDGQDASDDDPRGAAHAGSHQTPPADQNLVTEEPDLPDAPVVDASAKTFETGGAAPGVEVGSDHGVDEDGSGSELSEQPEDESDDSVDTEPGGEEPDEQEGSDVSSDVAASEYEAPGDKDADEASEDDAADADEAGEQAKEDSPPTSNPRGPKRVTGPPSSTGAGPSSPNDNDSPGADRGSRTGKAPASAAA